MAAMRSLSLPVTGGFAVRRNGPARLRAVLALAFLLAATGGSEVLAATSQIRQLAGNLQICTVPNPSSPASAFNISQSAVDGNGDYWVSYACKEVCADWRQCQVPAHTRGGSALLEGDVPKQAVAFVVDGMGGHLAYTTRQSGHKTVLLHTGVGGVSYMQSLSGQIESTANTNVVMVRWESGFSGWGWFTRTSAPAARVPNLTRRVASMIAWVHENLAGAGDFGTVGCSMGTQATLGAVYWHDVDPVVDYQLMVGGPPLWDLNSGCGRRKYSAGYCDLDATRACSSNADCASLSARSQCTIPGPVSAAWLYEQMANHVHATQACDVSAADGNTGIHAPFDESGFAFVTGDWDFDHPIDFQMDIWGSDGDRRWGMGDAMQVFNSITSAAGHQKRWNTTTDTGHCAAIGNGRALQLVTSGMDLGNDPPPPPPPPPPPNYPPVAVGAFADLNLSLAEQSDVQLYGKFRDEGFLGYRAESSAPSVASAEVVEGVVRVTGRSSGAATITVTATDNGGLSAQLSFDVAVGWLLGFSTPSTSVPEGRVARLPLALNRPTDLALSLSWRVDLEADRTTADAADIDMLEGTVAIPAGATEAFIEIAVLDDEDIEPAREQLVVELLAPDLSAEYALQPSSTLLEIQEGLCDRTPAVRDALRGGRPCWAPTPAELAERGSLDLSNRQIAALRSRDFLGLTGLEVLHLQENRLSALPPALFAGISALRELDLRNNPGAPFVFTMRLVRTDAETPWALGPAQVSAHIEVGAPTALSAPLTGEGALLSADALSIPAGQIAGPSIQASPADARGARLTLSQPFAVPATLCGDAGSGRHPCFQGFNIQAGPPLVLFKTPPSVVAEPPPMELTANGDRTTLALAPLFTANGGPLSFTATSDNPGLVAVRIDNGKLILDANADGADGAALITLTAADWAGQTASIRLSLVVEFVPPSLLGNWRLQWIRELLGIAEQP